MVREVRGRVEFSVPREVAFDYLVDPHHRPEWQSSLARVSDVDGEPRLGQTWVDETKAGLKPRMRTTQLDRPAHWSESGSWRAVRADLTLDLDEAPDPAPHEAPVGCTVRYRFRIHVLGPVGLLISVLSAPAVRADLKRAAGILSSPVTGTE